MRRSTTQQIAPWRRQRLARQQVAKDHAPAQQQLVGESFVGCGRRSRPGTAAAPSVPRHGAGRAFRPRPSPRRRLGSTSERRFSKPSAVTRPGRDQFPQRVFHFARQPSGGARQVGEERRAALAQLQPGPRARGARAIPRRRRFRASRLPAASRRPRAGRARGARRAWAARGPAPRARTPDAARAVPTSLRPTGRAGRAAPGE